MRTRTIAVVALLLSSVFVVGQDSSKAEVFGGYSYLRVNDSGNATNTNGWEAALTGNINRMFGITADFDGHYADPLAGGSNGKVYTFLFGPKLTAHVRNAALFVHALGGGSHVSVTGFSDTGAAWAFGGGVDVKAAPHISIRLGQLDYLGTHLGDDTQNNFRYSAGVVFNF